MSANDEQVDSTLLTSVNIQTAGPYSMELPQNNRGIVNLSRVMKDRKALAALGLTILTLLAGVSAFGIAGLTPASIDKNITEWPATFPIKENATQLPSQCREGYRLSETTYVHLCIQDEREEFYDIRKFVAFKKTATIIGIQLTTEEFQLLKRIQTNGRS